MNLRQARFNFSASGSFTKNKEKNIKIKETGDSRYVYIYIKTNQIKLDFNMIWFMGILRIYLEERLLKKYYVIKHLILLKIQNMMERDLVSMMH